MNPWLPTSFDPGSVNYRLICFPHAGGGAAVYHRWDRELPHDIKIVPIRLPGRESRIDEPAEHRLDELLGQMAPAVAPHCGKRFSVFGYSMGALLAFEFVRWLRATGAQLPDHLFVAACRAPHLTQDRQSLHALEDTAMIDGLIAGYGMADETTPEEQSLMMMMSNTIRADLRLVETYEYRQQAPLDVPIAALGGASDPLVSRAGLEGWRSHTAATFRARMLPGHHFFLRTQQRAILDVLELTIRGCS